MRIYKLTEYRPKTMKIFSSHTCCRSSSSLVIIVFKEKIY